MGPPESSSQRTRDETLDVFAHADARGAPLTAGDVADTLDCSRDAARGRLEDLVADGDLETRTVGAEGQVWWRPAERPQTERGRVSAAFEQAQFRELVETVSDYAIFVLDPGGHVRTWNEGARQLKGYEDEEIIGEHFSAFYTEDDREAGRPERNLADAAENQQTTDEGWRVRDDGTTFWANVTITALYDDDGDLQGFVKITRDMTDRREHERQLRKQKERFETLVREVKDYAIFLLDSDGHIQTWNEGARQLKGYEDEEIIGEHFSAFYTEDDREAGRPERNLEGATQAGRLNDEGWRVRDDGTTFWANVTITALYDDDGDVRGFAKVTRDLTERHRYEERLREQRDELSELNQINTVIRAIDQALVAATSREAIEQAVCDRLAASDTYSAAWVAEYTDDYAEFSPRMRAGVSAAHLDTKRNAHAKGDAERAAGATALRTRTTQLVRRPQDDADGDPRDTGPLGEWVAIAVPLVYNDVEYGVLTVYADDESAFDERKTAVLSELGETISHAIAAIRREERERMLTTLQGSTREFLRVDTHREIGDVIVKTLTTDLTLADALVYWFDTAENTLEPVSSSRQSDARTDGAAHLPAAAGSPAWGSFMEGDTQFVEGASPVGPGRRAMVVPLGDHGVLVAAVSESETFDANTRKLVELVAATAEAAFDRVESQTNLRERDELLQEQNRRLQRLNQVNTIIREVDQGLVQATTREEAQQVVCDRLTRNDRFRYAWVGAPNDVDDALAPRAWSGDGQGYLDSVDLAPGRGREEPEPAVVATRTGDVTVVSNVAENLRTGQWRKEAFGREFQSIISVPLSYGDVTYGVLTVYADHPNAFEEMERSVFGELGETIANAIDAVDTKQALLTDRVVELEFGLDDESTSFLGRLAERTGCEITFEGLVPLSDGQARVFFVAHDGSPDRIRDVLDDSVAVDSCQLISSAADDHLVETVLSGSTIPLTLFEYGASLRTLTATDEGIELSVDLPSTADVRGFVERFRAEYDSAEFVARRERERSVQTREGLSAELVEYLTERQLEVLKTAYYGGFFVSPRQSTASDIAERLDVSQPTVTEHLRAAERKVLDLLFDDPVTHIPE